MNKKNFLKIVSLSLIGTSLLSTCAFAEINNINNTSYVQQLYSDENSNIKYEQFEYNGKTVMLIKSLTGEVLNTIEEYNNSIYVDGVKIEMGVINEFDYKNIPKNYEFNNYSRSSISWGKWQKCETIKIKTGGLTTAVIAGLIALKTGWNPLGAAATVASLVAGKYESIEIKGEIRYGSSENGKYTHYERKSHVYGDGKFVKTITESGKRAS
jgi:hypothetical protein